MNRPYAVPPNKNADVNLGIICDGGEKDKQRFEWNELRKAINDFLAEQNINEDKQLGLYFIQRDIVVPETGTEIDSKKFSEVFKHKVIMYLFDDAAKQRRALIFSGCQGDKRRYSKICDAFDVYGIRIFDIAIQNKVKLHDVLPAKSSLRKSANIHMRSEEVLWYGGIFYSRAKKDTQKIPV